MKDSARYVKWSEEDKCYVGSSPGLLHGGCHGDDEKSVFEELCRVVDETIAIYLAKLLATDYHLAFVENSVRSTGLL